MQIKYILILKLTLIILSLMSSLACLILKILSQGFLIQQNPLQYTSCSDYFKLKYSQHHIIQLILNIQLICVAILGTIMTAKCLYIIFKQKPQEIDDLANTIWIKAEFIMTGIIVTFLVCLIGSISSALKEQQSCNNIHTQNFLIYLILISFSLISSLLLIGINMYLIYKNNSHLQDMLSSSYSDMQDCSQLSKFLQQNQILKNLQKMENQNIFDMDSTQIRQQLLNQHTMPADEDLMNGFQFGNKFSKFQKNYQTRLQRKIRKLKQKRALLNGNNQLGQNNKIQRVIDERFILGPQDELDPAYDRQKITQIGKQAIQKLQSKGYCIQERPYIERTILSKKFKALIKDEKKQDAQNNNQTQELPNKTNLCKVPQQIEQEIQIVINLDVRQQKAPGQYYTGQDLQVIQLDRIFYKQYIENEKREKQQQRLKILKQKKQKQLQSELQNAQRLKCSYQKYINQDRVLDRKYQQALQYASKKKELNQNFVQNELALHLKLKSTIQLQARAFHQEINKHFSQQIQIEDNYNMISIKQMKQMQSRSNRKRRSTQIDPNNIGKFKDRRNPIQIIRGKGALK